MMRSAVSEILRARAALGLSLMLFSLAAIGLAQPQPAIGVRYRSQDTVYLDTGTAGGLAEGDRLEVFRSDQRIGLLEIAYVAEHSASCRIIDETLLIQPGDRVVLQESRTAPLEPVTSDTEALEFDAEAMAPDPGYTEPPARPSSERTMRRPRKTRVSGVLELGWESFTDDTEGDRDFERFGARLSLRARDLGGLPLQLRVRMRAQENQRSRAYSNGAPASERRDRFYEAALLYQPEKGRFQGQIGRIAVSPFIAAGYLDGVIGQVRIVRGFDVGALIGSEPIFKSDSFAETRGQKYGGFTRFSALRRAGRPDLEIFVAGIREEGDLDVSREYVALETRYVPEGRWSFYQRAEIDLNNGWREEVTGTRTQLSNLALTLNTRVSQNGRFSISYDRWERYLTEESRSAAEEFFDNLLRQGLRVRYSSSKPRGLGFSVYAGYRAREGDEEDTLSLGGALRYANLANLGIRVGGDLLGYSNPMTEGFVARLETSKRFGRGHEISLLIGGRYYSNKLFESLENRSDQWIRLWGWVELPANLFARGGFEYSYGDDLEGQRITLGIGYRL